MELVTKCDQYLVAFVDLCSIFLYDFMTSQHSMMAPGSQATPADEATLRAECHQAGANDSSCVVSGPGQVLSGWPALIALIPGAICRAKGRQKHTALH